MASLAPAGTGMSLLGFFTPCYFLMTNARLSISRLIESLLPWYEVLLVHDYPPRPDHVTSI
jgi:hypothetical protein